MVIRSPFPVPLPDSKPFQQALFEIFDEYGDSTALKEHNSKKMMTFNHIKRMACSVANTLRDQYGFTKGDVLLSFLENRIEFPALFLGVAALGGMTSGANPLYTPEELARQVADSGAKYIVTSGPLFAKVAKAVDSLKGSTSLEVISIFLIDPSTESTTVSCPVSVIGFEELCRSSYSSFPEVSIDPKEDAVLLPYSSGTTGLPKGVILTHYNLLCLLFARFSSGGLHQPRQVDLTAILYLPFFHMAGFMSLIFTMITGGLGIVMLHFDPRRYVEAIQQHKVTQIYAVPSVLVFLAKDPIVEKYDLSSVKTVTFGAAPAGNELIEAITKRLPKLEAVVQGYGMTETGGLATITPRMPTSQYPMGSCGVPTPYTELKVVTIDGKAQELGPMETGEIWTRGPSNMKGYYRKPEATKEIIDSDGWLHTGDIGYYDFLGHVHVIDRLKELIKYKGYQVAPAELEDILLKHPFVKEAVAVGIPDKTNPDVGELPTAYIVLKSGFTPSERSADSIKRLIADHLAPFKHLRGGVIFVENIPKGGSGKVLRRMVKEMPGKVYGAETAGKKSRL